MNTTMQNEADEVKLFKSLRDTPLTLQEVEKEREYKPKYGRFINTIKVKAILFWNKHFGN